MQNVISVSPLLLNTYRKYLGAGVNERSDCLQEAKRPSRIDSNRRNASATHRTPTTPERSNMIIGGTINLGGYANHKYRSNEYDTPEACIDDLRVELLMIREPRVDAYLRRVFVGETERQK